MAFLINLICLVLLVWAVVRYRKLPTVSALLALAGIVLAGLAGLFLHGVAAIPVRTYLVAPVVEKQAGNELADMFSAEHLETGMETVEKLDLAGLVSENPPAFAKMLDRYGVSIDTLRELPISAVSADILRAVTVSRVDGIAESVAFLVVVVVIYLLMWLVRRRVELNLPPAPSCRGAAQLLPMGIGLLSGLVQVCIVTYWLFLIGQAIPGDAIFFAREDLNHVFFYTILKGIRDFARL